MLIALLGHVVLFAGTICAAKSIDSVGPIDLFFWTGIIIGLWAALGAPRAVIFSTGFGCFQIVVQAIVIIAIMVENARHRVPQEGDAEWGEVVIFFDLVKSGIVFFITVGIVRGGVGLVRRDHRSES